MDDNRKVYIDPEKLPLIAERSSNDERQEAQELGNENDQQMKTSLSPSWFLKGDYPNVLVFVLVMLFGLSSWIVVNGLYTALPILILKLPEGYEIATYMNLALQLANIFPFIFFLLTCLLTPWKKIRFQMDTIAVFVLILIGIIACVLMTFLWDRTFTISKHERSLAFLSLVFVTGAADCTSSVVYWPFISNYKYYYTTALSIGEGSTALVSGIIGLIMQPGPKPVFSFPIFAGILAIILCISGIAFALLRFLPYCQSQLLDPSTPSEDMEDDNKTDDRSTPGNIQHQQQTTTTLVTTTAATTTTNFNKAVSVIRLTVIQMVISFFQNGLLVSISPYLFHAYPNNIDLLRYSIIINQILDPLACFLAYPLIRFYNWSIVALGVHLVWITLSVFQFGIALKNPNPPRAGSLGMGIGLVIISIITRVFISFAKTCEWIRLHREQEEWKTLRDKSNEDEDIAAVSMEQKPNDDTAEYSKKWRTFIGGINPFRIAGIGIQVGALLGSIMMFLLTKYHVLKRGH